MSWLNKLYDTYENCESVIGKYDADQKIPLLPIAHSTQNAQIEVRLDSEGNFKNAVTVDKKDAVTVIPVSEDSAARSSGIFPHPLFDKLQYIAGDYIKYVDGKKGEYFKKYIQGLEAWCNSPFANKKACAVLTYLKKETLIADLIEQKVLICGEDGKLNRSVKLDVSSQCDAFVRFRVYGEDRESRVWLDEEVQNSFAGYYISLNNSKELCYASGKNIACSEKHPAKVRNTADKAKLISGNDESGFTYRGRFSNKGQAISVGYETTQKAHNALKWLIDRQGYRNYEQVIVAWETKNQNLPPISEDTCGLFPEEERLTPPSTAEEFAGRLSSAISGYKCDLDNKAEIVVMGLDSATTGRLSITYYRELDGSDFLERIKHWHSSCIWRHSYKIVADGADEKGKPQYRRIKFIGAPAPKDIAAAAFGAKASDKLIKATLERLLPCIVDRAKIPYDLVKAAVKRASNPISTDGYEWEKVRTITCALVKKYRFERHKEVWLMELEKEVTDTHYLCGRLLAVADEIESWALYEMKEKRETNAIRLFERFAQNPSKVWGIIVKRLIPYQNKLTKLGKSYKWLLDIREEISEKINFEEFKEIKNLDGRFILGFDCQKKNIHDEINRRKEARVTLNKKDNGVNEEEDNTNG